jgi:integral membrane protein
MQRSWFINLSLLMKTFLSQVVMFNFLRTPLARLRAVSILEGASLLLLLGVAMPLKYLAHEPAAVRVVGMIHGVLFVAYVLLLIQNTIERRWSAGKFGLGLVLSVLPCGAFYAERRLFQPGDGAELKG